MTISCSFEFTHIGSNFVVADISKFTLAHSADSPLVELKL